MSLNSKTHGTLRSKLVQWSLLIIVSCFCILLGIKYTILKMEVAFARGQVSTFEAIKASAEMTTDASKIARSLEYVINYYPSGTKQVEGSALDCVVEVARSNATDALITRLRVTTKKDLGADPNIWLKAYLNERSK